MWWWLSSNGEPTGLSPGVTRSLGPSGATCRSSGPLYGQEEQDGISRAHSPGCGTAETPPPPPSAEMRGALERLYSKPRHHFLVAADHGVELSDDVIALAADVV